MSKHTPGPWMADSHYPSVSAPTAPNLALCNDHAIPMSERIANARLIAAAPDLLEALKEVVAFTGALGGPYVRARAAIKAVEGENT